MAAGKTDTSNIFAACRRRLHIICVSCSPECQTLTDPAVPSIALVAVSGIRIELVNS
jgi:hypothetical protein